MSTNQMLYKKNSPVDLADMDMGALIRYWEERNSDPSFDPVPMLTRLAEMIEAEYENFLKTDPDPFDERHPSRTDPNGTFGQMLKSIFRKELFMNKLVNDYMQENYLSRIGYSSRNIRQVNIVACRLIIDILPGLETSIVFETPTNDNLIQRLYTWAENGGEPLQTYATALLAAAMEVQDIANLNRDLNNKLIPIMLDRLYELHEEHLGEKASVTNGINHIDMKRPFSQFCIPKGSSSYNGKPDVNDSEVRDEEIINDGISRKNPKIYSDSNGWNYDSAYGEHASKKKISEINGVSVVVNKSNHFGFNEGSNSSWTDVETSTVRMYPPTIATKQLFILKYLAPMGDYQEYLGILIEKRALQLVLMLIDRNSLHCSRVTFEALRYLASLLCHKKFAIEFINLHGLEKLLDIPRPGIASTGVSICLFYLSHCEDAMERVCFLPLYLVSKLISYALWLLESSHDSGRCHATMFFGLSFQFSMLLKEFDAQDGLRRGFNLLSSLPILSSDNSHRGDDEECSTRQIVRHVCTALKRYMEAHLYVRAETVQTFYNRDYGCLPMQRVMPGYKAHKFTPELTRENLTFVTDFLCIKPNWSPVDEFLELGGIPLMLKIIAFTYEWNYSGRAETVRDAIDVIGICAVSTTVQLKLCDRLTVSNEKSMSGIQILLGASENEGVGDPEVQKSALNVLITCACAPLYKEGEFVKLFRYHARQVRKKCYKLTQCFEEAVNKVWECIRTSNGIMVLMSLIMTKVPITEADCIRCLACQALAGLARSDTVKQIISKLPLFTDGLLQNLMKDPVLSEKRQEHVMFQKFALELLERVYGNSKSTVSEFEASLVHIHKANVVAQTRIQFNDKQLFQIIHQHLLKHGMAKSANALQKEANLPPVKCNPSTSNCLSPFSYSCRQSRLSTSNMYDMMKQPKQLMTSYNPTLSTNDDVFTSPGSFKFHSNTPPPIKLSINKLRDQKPCLQSPNRSFQRQVKCDNIYINNTQGESHVTLDYIVTEYLANQHSNCKNPMMTCPPFDLLRPHRCPDPKPKTLLYGNFATRHAKGIRMRRLDEHLIHSRFCPVKTFRLSEEDGYYTCCKFLNDKQLAVGTYQGDLKILNLCTGSEEFTYACHDSYLASLAKNSDGTLVLTSSTWRSPLSGLWKLHDNICESVYKFQDEENFEFSNLSDSRIIGTKNETAKIYDVITGKEILTLTPKHGNQYTKNKATFNPLDELVLSDGVLWDVNSGKEIHKFDKLNQVVNGVFHPNGLEILSNTEVWDTRTFHLLKTVPALDQCNIIFPYTSRVLYAISVEKDNENDSGYESSFKSLDAYDYSSILTTDVKRPIYDLACNKFDTQIALVENFGNYDNVEESLVRLYEVGRKKEEDDSEAGEEDETDNSEVATDDEDPQDESVDILDLDELNSEDDDNDDDDDDDFEDSRNIDSSSDM